MVTSFKGKATVIVDLTTGKHLDKGKNFKISSCILLRKPPKQPVPEAEKVPICPSPAEVAAANNPSGSAEAASGSAGAASSSAEVASGSAEVASKNDGDDCDALAAAMELDGDEESDLAKDLEKEMLGNN